MAIEVEVFKGLFMIILSYIYLRLPPLHSTMMYNASMVFALLFASSFSSSGSSCGDMLFCVLTSWVCFLIV